MDIGPVSAILPVPGSRSLPGGPDVFRVTETLHRDQSRDDDYTPAARQASRGLEDEEGEELADEESSASTPSAPFPGKVSFFA